MTIEELFASNPWTETMLDGDTYTVKTAFLDIARQPITLEISSAGLGWKVTDGGQCLGLVKALVPEDIREATAHEFQFSAIKLGFKVDGTHVGRTVESLEDIDHIVQWLIQWNLESSGVMQKIISIHDEAFRSFGVNWTGSDDRFQDELKD